MRRVMREMVLIAMGLFMLASAVWAQDEAEEHTGHVDPMDTLAGISDVAMPRTSFHPSFMVLDKDGQPISVSKATMDESRTCAACHDVEFINSHNSHHQGRVKVDCLACHGDGGEWTITAQDVDENGMLPQQAIRIGAPQPENCGMCHGMAHDDRFPMRLPNDFDSKASLLTDEDPFSQTRRSGVIFSRHPIRDSYLNIEGKDDKPYAWDVHAERLLSCADCHYPANSPKHSKKEAEPLAHLRNDPRRMDLGDFLKKPDHRLLSSKCTDCHDPMVIHEDLPYKQRHMERVSCQSCHVPEWTAPVARTIDATLPLADGGSQVEYWNADADRGKVANVRYVRRYQPFLLTALDDDGQSRVHAANMLTSWYWRGKEIDEPLSRELLMKAFFVDGELHPNLAAALDDDHDGKVEDGEWKLGDDSEIAAARARLVAVGVNDPKIVSRLDVLAVSHGVKDHNAVTLDCTRCHGEQTAIDRPVMLTASLVGGMAPQGPSTDGLAVGGSIVQDRASVTFAPQRSGDVYILGHDRQPWSDLLGLAFFIMTALGLGAHASYRIFTRKHRQQSHAKMKRVYMYQLYERIWHWLMAASIILLALTGLEIHYMGSLHLFGFRLAVDMHNVLAVIMIVNALLSLFYHLATANIRQFIPRRESFIQDVLVQAQYYLNGIFVGAPHPIEKTPERKLNPLQQITYMGLMNVLFPFQVVTGLLIWAVSQWPETAANIQGLSLVAPLHNLGSWLLLSFIAAHLYLITTGHTLTSNLKAMVTGYEDIEVASDSESNTAR